MAKQTMIVNLSIDVTKIDKSRLKEVKLRAGATAKYLNLTLIENRNGRDQWGNDGMVVESATQEERAAGKRGTILGNYRIQGVRPDTGTPGTEEPETTEQPIDDTEVPF